MQQILEFTKEQREVLKTGMNCDPLFNDLDDLVADINLQFEDKNTNKDSFEFTEEEIRASVIFDQQLEAGESFTFDWKLE